MHTVWDFGHAKIVSTAYVTTCPYCPRYVEWLGIVAIRWLPSVMSQWKHVCVVESGVAINVALLDPGVRTGLRYVGRLDCIAESEWPSA